MKRDMALKNSVGVRVTELSPRDTCHDPSPAAAPSGSAGLQRMLPPRLLRFPKVRERTGLSRSTIWRLERRGEFPHHRRISPNAVAWVEHEISNWIRARIGDAEV